MGLKYRHFEYFALVAVSIVIALIGSVIFVTRDFIGVSASYVLIGLACIALILWIRGVVTGFKIRDKRIVNQIKY